VSFRTSDLQNVSFLNSDITAVVFDENATFGKSGSSPIRYITMDERNFEKQLARNTSLPSNKENSSPQDLTGQDELLYQEPTLGALLALYRNLRENYEYRLRYDEAGQFFVREMEIKRKYREEFSIRKNRYIPNVNKWFRQNFSLTGLYYHLSKYGESISRPVILAIIIVGLSTLFWLIQNNPTGEPSISYIASNELGIAKTSADNFINFTQFSNNTHTLKAFERTLADFLPLLSMPSDTKIGIIDFIVKIVGGGLTFVLLGVALRRKFERKYTITPKGL